MIGTVEYCGELFVWRLVDGLVTVFAPDKLANQNGKIEIFLIGPRREKKARPCWKQEAGKDQNDESNTHF